MRVASYDSIMMDKVKPTEALWEPLSRRAFVMPGKRGDHVPRSPKKPCAYPGCPRLTDRRFCPEHEKLDRDRYNKYERSPDVNRKYGRAWKRIRDRYAAAHPLCEQCLKEGLMDVFMDAGCIVGPCTCGPCLGGHMGILGDGERAVATTNRNFRGRMGSLDSEVYLSSPVVAAASAVAGCIAGPDQL